LYFGVRRHVAAFLKHRHVCALHIVLAGTSLSAQGADLLEVYRLAQASDPTFGAARYTYEAAQQNIPQARAGILPVVNVVGDQTDNRSSSQFTTPGKVNRDVESWNWTLRLTQPLFRAQNHLAYRESVLLVEQARAQYSQAEQDLILRVTQAYFDVLIAQESIAVADAQLKAAEEQLALVKGGFEAGANAITDVHEAKSRAELARSQRIAAINELDAKRAELEKVIGQPSNSLSALRPALLVPKPQPEDVHAWVEQARENNPAVLAPIAALQAAEVEIKKNRAEHLPTFDLVASYGQNYSSGIASAPTDFTMRASSNQIALQFNMPLTCRCSPVAQPARA